MRLVLLRRICAEQAFVPDVLEPCVGTCGPPWGSGGFQSANFRKELGAVSHTRRILSMFNLSFLFGAARNGSAISGRNWPRRFAASSGPSTTNYHGLGNGEVHLHLLQLLHLRPNKPPATPESETAVPCQTRGVVFRPLRKCQTIAMMATTSRM